MSTFGPGQIMEKTVGAFEVRRSFGRILQEVAAKGDRVVVERHGEPIAAVVPIDVYNQWKRSRAEFFERMRRAAEQANLSLDDADQLAAEAVTAIRAAD
jgi:prevent-host-death family protein